MFMRRANHRTLTRDADKSCLPLANHCQIPSFAALSWFWLQELGPLIASIVGCLMAIDLVTGKEKHPDLLEATRKVCSFLAKKVGMSREDLPTVLKGKLDDLTPEKLAVTRSLIFVKLELDLFWSFAQVLGQ